MADPRTAAAATSILLTLGLVCFAEPGFAQQPDSSASAEALKKLSIEQLMNLEVTSVSRRPERLAQAASAIQVITQADIRRSGASSLPEALRLATNLQVAQVNSRDWAISARGFNSTTANKLLVLIEQLMNLEVTSVSRRPERLAQAASAIQVITQADIRRSGASSLPEALRLATNLQVAQVNSRDWAISARGFNSTTANKLLVLIDG